MHASSPPPPPEPTPTSRPSLSARPLRSRLGPRVVVLPIIIIVVAWLLQTQNASVEQERLAEIRGDVRRFVDGALAGRPDGELAAELGEAMAGLRESAARLVRAEIGDAAAAGLDVVATAGREGGMPRSDAAATHTATIVADGRPRLHLWVGVTGDRTVLAGWTVVPAAASSGRATD